MLHLKPLFAKFRKSLGFSACRQEQPRREIACESSVQKDMLSFLMVATNTSHIETGTVSFWEIMVTVSVLASGKPRWPVGPAL